MARPGAVRIIAGDARELPGVQADSIGLIVTSPPYPMIPQWDALYASWGATSFDGMHQQLDRVWGNCARVLVPGGILAVNIGDAVRSIDGTFRLWPNHARVVEAAGRLGLQDLPYILWKKPTNKPNAFLGSGFLPPNAYVTLDCEFILLFRKGRLRRFPRRSVEREASRYTKAERDVWFSQIWDGIRGRPQALDGGRSGAFPPEIPRRLIRMFSVEGDTVLDPFAGTGTTLWESARLGRDAIGVELDPKRAQALELEAGRFGRRGGEGPFRSGGAGPLPRRPAAGT